MEDYNERIAQIQQRLDAATPGPWVNHWKEDRVLGDGPDHMEDVAISSDAPGLEGIDRLIVGQMWYDGPRTVLRQENADFLTNAPADIQWLLAELATTRATLSTLEGEKAGVLEKKLGELRQRLANGRGQTIPRSQVYDALSTLIDELRTPKCATCTTPGECTKKGGQNE